MRRKSKTGGRGNSPPFSDAADKRQVLVSKTRSVVKKLSGQTVVGVVHKKKEDQGNPDVKRKSF